MQDGLGLATDGSRFEARPRQDRVIKACRTAPEVKDTHTPPPPHPPPIPPVYPPTHHHSTTQYPDHKLSSDSDHDAEFIQNYGNLINSAVPNSSTNLTSTSDYYSKLSTHCHFLPFGGTTKFNKTKLKWIRKLEKSRQRKQNALAQRIASISPSVHDIITSDDSPVSSSVTSSIGKYAASKLNFPETCVFSYINDNDNCCADSGATNVMLPDYYVFISYHKYFHCFAILDDSTKLPILGKGTTVFSLNGKTIMVQDAIHVPSLRAPLYSLRKHKTIHGYGTFSLHHVGSYILFPNFSLRTDDSVDNLVG